MADPKHTDFMVANPEHIGILKQGAQVWNKWRREHPDVCPYLHEADLRGLDLRKADLSCLRLQLVNLNKADLIGANLYRTDFYLANLMEARLDGANCVEAGFDLAYMHFARCVGTDFTGASFSSTRLVDVNFREAKLRGAYLENADLGGANFNFSKLNGADLSYAKLFNTNFDGAHLTDADFSNAHMGGGVLTSNDLSSVKGLDTVRHYQSSSIGIDTLYLSQGKIPEAFLAGCGVPDSFIAQARALVEADDALLFYSCFISYSSKDEEFTKRLHSRMRDERLRVWFAPEEMKSGQKLHEQIERAIQVHDRLLIVLSENSLQSEWVKTEIRKARRIEIRENRRKLFPISLVPFEVIRDWECFDADTGKDLGVEIREYFIPDFSEWKSHDSFEAAFKRLLRALKVEEHK